MLWWSWVSSSLKLLFLGTYGGMYGCHRPPRLSVGWWQALDVLGGGANHTPDGFFFPPVLWGKPLTWIPRFSFQKVERKCTTVPPAAAGLCRSILQFASATHVATSSQGEELVYLFKTVLFLAFKCTLTRCRANSFSAACASLQTWVASHLGLLLSRPKSPSLPRPSS